MAYQGGTPVNSALCKNVPGCWMQQACELQALSNPCRIFCHEQGASFKKPGNLCAVVIKIGPLGQQWVVSSLASVATSIRRLTFYKARPTKSGKKSSVKSRG